jgi:hypothetical protein
MESTAKLFLASVRGEEAGGELTMASSGRRHLVLVEVNGENERRAGEGAAKV